MSLSTVSVTTTKTTLLPAGIRRRSVLLANTSTTVPVYLKLDSSVTVLTAANGFPLAPGGTMVLSTIPDEWRDPIEGITASGTADVRVTEIN